MTKKLLLPCSVLTLIFLINVKSSFAILTPIVDSIPMSDGRKLAADVYIPKGITQGPITSVKKFVRQ